MTLILIDDAGGIWDGGSSQVREAFNSPHSGGEFTDYVVRNLGFIAINRYSATSLQVRLAPALTTSRAYETMGDWMSRHRAARIALRWFSSGKWFDQLVMPGQFLWQIDALMKAARGTSPRAILTRGLPPDCLPNAASLQALLQHLPESLEPGQQQALLSLVRRSIGDRYVMVEGDPNIGKLVFVEFGPQIYKQQLPWQTRPIGQPVDQQPDPAYGQWVHESYKDVLRTGRTRIEDVDAIVDWQQQGRMRLRYRRIVVPFRTANDRVRVLTGSIKDDRIDLRVG